MIVDRLERAQRYFAIHPGFAAAFAFLKHHSSGDLPAGRHAVEGERLYAMVVGGQGRREEAQLEYHQKYIDIQYVVSGRDDIGWKPTPECVNVAKDFDPDGDCGLFTDEPQAWLPVPSGAFAIFFPEDAHAPLGGEGGVDKVVMKVATDW